MREHARGRYAAAPYTADPVPSMSQLPMNPILAALPKRFGNRRITAGLPSMLPPAHVHSAMLYRIPRHQPSHLNAPS